MHFALLLNFPIIFGAVLIVTGIGFLSWGIRKTNESNNLARYVPTDNINSIPFDVPVVATGTVVAAQPLISPITKKPCVYFSYTLERETKRKESNGMISWEWQQVGNPELQTIPFYLQDSSGKILIKPENCEVNGIYRTQQFLQPGTVQNIVSKGVQAVADAFQFGNPAKQGDRERVTETTIFINAQLNVFGILTMEGNQKFLQQTRDYPLVLSPLSKDQLVGSERKNSFLFYGSGILLLLVGILVTSLK